MSDMQMLLQCLAIFMCAIFSGASIYINLVEHPAYTLTIAISVNKRLLSQELDKRSEEAFQLLKKWNKLHMMRSVLSTLALIIFLLIKP